jgi:hypothetical protein
MLSIHASRALKNSSPSPALTTLVPGISFRDVQFGFWREDQLNGHATRGLGVSLLPTPAQKPGSS